MRNLLSLILATAIMGCYSTTGFKLEFRDSTGVNLGNITAQNSTWPVVSCFTGPTFSMWINKDYAPNVYITGHASLTNEVSAFGILGNQEGKDLQVGVWMSQTNAVPPAEKSISVE